MKITGTIVQLKVRGSISIGKTINWTVYFATRYISVLEVVTTSDTTQTITATIVGTGYDGVSFEYSSDNGITWSAGIIDADGVLNQTGLTLGTLYLWRARLYKGIHYGGYSDVEGSRTLLAETITQKTRIEADGGIVIDLEWLNNIIYLYKGWGIYTSCKFWGDFNVAVKKDGSNRVATLYDISGNNNDVVQATDDNKPVTGTYIGDFDGSNDILKNTTATPLITSGGITISCRIKSTGWGQNKVLVTKRYMTGGDWINYMVMTSNDANYYLYFLYTNGSVVYHDWKTTATISALGLLDGNDHELAITLTFGTDTSFRLYIDGVSIAGSWFYGTANLLPTGRNGNERLCIGSNIDGLNSTDCELYNICIFNAALSQENVNNLSSLRPDGVWESKGIVLHAEVAAEFDNLFEPNIIYEGLPKILTNATNVFKMWYTSGWGWGNLGINYAESEDGKIWTKYAGNPIIEDYCRSSIIKVAGTYYLYCSHNDTAIDLFTSTDGINFILDTADVLMKGGGGAWDSSYIANSFIIIEGGTWYMFYDAVGTVAYWRTGLATSADGRTWTKYSATPIISEAFQVSGPCVRKIGTSFYLWGHGGLAATLPNDLNHRYKSADLITWIRDTKGEIYIRSTTDEGIGSAVSQVADVFLIEVDDKTYLFYSSSTNGNLQAGELHIKLAIADMSFADLVLTQEGNKL